MRLMINALEKAVGRTHIAQAPDSPGYMKKALIINKVTTYFFITSFKSQKGRIAIWTAANRPPVRVQRTNRQGEGHGRPESVSYALCALPTAFSGTPDKMAC